MQLRGITRRNSRAPCLCFMTPGRLHACEIAAVLRDQDEFSHGQKFVLRTCHCQRHDGLLCPGTRD